MEVELMNQLIKKIAKNDEKALIELFNLTKSDFYGIAYKYIIEKSYVEDVLSEVYLKIYRNAKTYKDGYNSNNWMHEIIKNTALDFNRKYNFEKEVVSFDEKTYVLKISNKYIFENKELHKALKKLSKEEYYVVFMKIWRNATLRTISESTGKSMKSVQYVYDKAIAKLKKEIE